MKKALKILSAILLSLFLLVYFYFLYPFWGIPFNAQRHGNPPLTPAWALECWLWEDDYNTAEYVEGLLEGYREHDIPVRTIILDSPWSYRYNDFEVDTVLYPDPESWFKKIKDRDYRIVLWMTSMINSYNKGLVWEDSQDWHDSIKEKGYLAQGKENKWWKGRGGYIDYTNPEAMNWWRGMQQTVFDYGIDGWKLDGAATLFYNEWKGIPFFYKKTASGWMTTRSYMDHYYREEYQHGLSQNPEFITLSRAIDRWYHPEGFSPVGTSPVNWVGDQEHSWKTSEMLVREREENVDIALDGIEGFESAIQSVLKSAKLGYSVIGSDIAGFSGSVIPPRLYIRWAQFSTFCGLFMNGGHGDRGLWNRSKEELEIIRKYSWLHTELVPYMYHYVVTAHHGGTRLQRPVNGKYHYMFGDYLLVAPIFEDKLDNEVNLPEGKWRYWLEDKELLEGPLVLNREFPLEEYPVYVKEGAIIPMNIERNYTGFGREEYKGYLTWLLYPSLEESEFTLYREKEESTRISMKKEDGLIKIQVEGKQVAQIFKVHLSERPSLVKWNGKNLLMGTDYHFEEDKHKLILRTEAAPAEVELLVLW